MENAEREAQGCDAADNGIVFTAPELYVERMKERLVNCYGCSLKPIITEY